MGSLLPVALQHRWITLVAFVVTVAGFSLQQEVVALLGIALFATDLVVRARRAFRAPRPPA